MSARRRRHAASRASLVFLLCLAVPTIAQPSTLTVEDEVISIAECSDRGNQAVELAWDLSSSSGSSIEILGSDASGCSESDATTAVLADGVDASQTSYPSSGDATITLADLLAAAGGTPSSCEGSDFRVYVCVRLLDDSGNTVTTASAVVKLQLERPAAPTGLSVSVGERALYVGFEPGTVTTAAPANSETFRAFASSGGATFESAETSSTKDLRIGGLENGTTYDVWAVAYSEAGNPSDASELTSGTPQPVLGFYEAYRESGGTEAGGCSGAGARAASDWPVMALLVGLILIRFALRRPR